MSKGDLQVEFLVRENAREPYIRILKDGTVKLVIIVNQEEMNETVLPKAMEAYDKNHQ